MKNLEQIDKALDRAEWKEIDGKELEEILRGQTIAGAEPIDYPLTDGAILYLTGKDGKLSALEIGVDIYNDDSQIYIKYAATDIKA